MLIRCGSCQIKAKFRRCPLTASLWGYQHAGRRQSEGRRAPIIAGNRFTERLFCYCSMTLLSPSLRPNPSLVPRRDQNQERVQSFQHLIGHSGTCGTKTSVDQRTNGAILSKQSKSTKQQRSLKRFCVFHPIWLKSSRENTKSDVQIPMSRYVCHVIDAICHICVIVHQLFPSLTSHEYKTSTRICN